MTLQKPTWRGSVQVGDLVECKITGKYSIVTWTGLYGSHFKVMGYPINQVFTTVHWRKRSIDESR